MFFDTPLQKLIKQGMTTGDISGELLELDDYQISSKKDAKSICKALRSLPSQKSNDPYGDVHCLAALFQEVESRTCPAFEVLVDEGNAELIRLYDEIVRLNDEEKESDLLFLLKILVAYATKAGAQRVVDAAKSNLSPDSYPWCYVFGEFFEGHPQKEFVLGELSDPVPEGFLGICLLDCANEAATEEGLAKHPFDNPSGIERLNALLKNPDPEKSSFAISATSALPFISNPDQAQLTDVGMAHRDKTVQIAAASAAASAGMENGLSFLAKTCLDVDHSDVARKHLADLNRSDLIPKEAQDPDFLAKADFARWLAHSNELGESPDELEIIDKRELVWPLEDKPAPIWLIKYCLRDPYRLKKDDVDIGMVGKTTWCFFSHDMLKRPIEDCYAMHCYWEMEQKELIAEDAPEAPTEFLANWSGKELESAETVLVITVSKQLVLFPDPVAVVSAKIEGAEGWAVIDGASSQWYPESEQPDDTSKYSIAMLHVGRRLLGFEKQPDRKLALANPVPVDPAPQEFLNNYERLLAEMNGASVPRQNELLGKYGILKRRFEGYVAALTGVNGKESSGNLVDAYDALLKYCLEIDESIRVDSIDSMFGLFGTNFEAYVDEKISQGRQAEVMQAIEAFEPYWGSAEIELANAAYKAGNSEKAEALLVEYRSQEEESFFRCEDGINLLVTIWSERGETQKTAELLLDCLKKVLVDFEDSDSEHFQERCEERFQSYRATYLKLFSEGESQLAKENIPQTLL